MEDPMSTVKVSPKYQVVIPKTVREKMGLKSGTKVQIFRFQNRIELVPVKDIRKMRGMLKGIDTTVERDDKDRV
jgi:AbrB family looped-hinge helix DNA binding protein